MTQKARRGTVVAEARGRIDGGALRLDRVAFARQVARLGDGPVVVRVEREADRRTSEANAYYWGVVLKLIADETGQTPHDLHEYFKGQHLAQPILLVDRDGVIRHEATIGGSTSKLTTSEFYDYVERVRADAADLGIVIPDPDGGARR